MKHAGATEAMVQLIKEDDRFSIVVEDNGKGFDTTLLKTNKGAGLTSIQSRVDYLKGQLDINSEQDKGTLVNIEFNI
jgi:signal transduction histidine kinase